MEEIVYSNIQAKDCGICSYDYDDVSEEWIKQEPDSCTDGCSCGAADPAANPCYTQDVPCA